MLIKNISIVRRVTLTVISTVALIVALFFLFSFSVDTFSSIRAYVGAEGLWSKAQKDATIALQNYIRTRDEKYFLIFNQNINVILGDRIAREELEKPDANLAIADAGFIQGGNNPNDARGMSLLFRRFRHVSYIDQAIGIWAEGDKLIDRLASIGNEAHGKIQDNILTAKDTENFYAVINEVNTQVSILESKFSRVLGDASRWARNIIIMVLASVSLLFGILIFYSAFNIGRFIKTSLGKIKAGVLATQRGDKNYKIDLETGDELSELADSFNDMSSSLTASQSDLETKNIKLVESLEQSIKAKEQIESAQKAVLNILADLKVEQRKSAEISVKDEAMLEAIGDGFIASDEKGYVIRVNPRLLEMTGFTEKEVLGNSITKILELHYLKEEKLIKPEDQPALETLTTGKPASGIFHVLRKDKSKFVGAITVSTILLGEKPIGIIEIIRDVTKESEVDRAKSEFVSLASHQLRTPLSIIGWYSEMLLGGDVGNLNENQKKYLQEIYQGNRRMVELVNALLNVSRLEMGTFVIEPKLADITEIAESVLKELSHQIETKKQKLEKTYDSKLPKVNMDVKLMRIILQNLISNAVKYTPTGGKVTLNIGLEGKNVLIKVADTGIGIPEKQQANIFIKLFRADNARESDAEGTGLGLYIVKSILDQAGGKVWFESGKDNGAVFYVSIPLSGMQTKTGLKPLL